MLAKTFQRCEHDLLRNTVSASSGSARGCAQETVQNNVAAQARCAFNQRRAASRLAKRATRRRRRRRVVVAQSSRTEPRRADKISARARTFARGRLVTASSASGRSSNWPRPASCSLAKVRLRDAPSARYMASSATKRQLAKNKSQQQQQQQQQRRLCSKQTCGRRRRSLTSAAILIASRCWLAKWTDASLSKLCKLCARAKFAKFAKLANSPTPSLIMIVVNKSIKLRARASS